MVSSEYYRESLVKNLITIKESIKEHASLVELEKEVQRGILDRLWVLSQRFSILIKGVPTHLRIPKEAIQSPEEEIRADFLTKLNALQGSNLKLSNSLTNVRNNSTALEHFLDEMGANHLSMLDSATSLQLPFASCFEILEDFLKYFSKLQSQMNCFAHLLRPNNVTSIDQYKKILKPNRDFDEHFSKSLAMLYNLKKTN